MLDTLDYELRNSVATGDLEWLGRIGVHQKHLELTSIARIDQARRVEAGNAIAVGKT